MRAKKSKAKKRRRPLKTAGTLWQILITAGGKIPLANQYMQIGSYDSISFRNTAGFPVNIVITNVFPTITNLSNNVTSGAQGGATSLNVTLNYTIFNAGNGQKTDGPCAVQFGVGPLPVSITADDTAPDPVAIPHGGQIQFFNHDNNSYSIDWKMGGNPAFVWTPQPVELYIGLNSPPQKALPGANGQSLTYTLTAKLVTRGGGTVTVGS